MKFKGKIVQVVKEEESHKIIGTHKIDNNDWLNIINMELYNYQNSKTFKNYRRLFFRYFLLAVLLFTLAHFLNSNPLLEIIGAISLITAFYTLYRSEPKYKTSWPVNQLIPVVKPHNFKVNDEVEITLEIKK
jgi:hypothetical protein